MTLRVRWLCAGALLGTASGCPDPKPCNSHLHDGESFTVQVLGKVDPELVERPWYIDEGTPSCGDLDGVETGARLPVTLDDYDLFGNENQCKDFVCPVDFPGPAQESPAPIGRYGGNFLCFNGKAQLAANASCQVQRVVALEDHSTSSIYEEPDTNGTSSVTLVRALVVRKDLPCTQLPDGFPDAEIRTSYFCYDQWNVQLVPNSTK